MPHKLTKEERFNVIVALVMIGHWKTAAKMAETPDEFSDCMKGMVKVDYQSLHDELVREPAQLEQQVKQDLKDGGKPLQPQPNGHRPHWTTDKAKVEEAHRKASATKKLITKLAKKKGISYEKAKAQMSA